MYANHLSSINSVIFNVLYWLIYYSNSSLAVICSIYQNEVWLLSSLNVLRVYNSKETWFLMQFICLFVLGFFHSPARHGFFHCSGSYVFYCVWLVAVLFPFSRCCANFLMAAFGAFNCLRGPIVFVYGEYGVYYSLYYLFESFFLFRASLLLPAIIFPMLCITFLFYLPNNCFLNVIFSPSPNLEIYLFTKCSICVI